MKARRDIDIADPLAVVQRVTLEIMNGGFGEPKPSTFYLNDRDKQLEMFV